MGILRASLMASHGPPLGPWVLNLLYMFSGRKYEEVIIVFTPTILAEEVHLKKAGNQLAEI